MEKIYDKTIVALLPSYKKDIGDSTDIIMIEEEVFVKKTIQTVVKLLCNYYMLDLKEIKKSYSDILNAKNLFPIPFDRENIFIPFKYRKPLYKNDKAFGYINLDWIARVEAREKESLIQLKNGKILRCKASLTTTEKHIRNGKIIRSCYVERKMGDRIPDYSKKEIDRLLLLIRDLTYYYE